MADEVYIQAMSQKKIAKLYTMFWNQALYNLISRLTITGFPADFTEPQQP
jgi:hypothetical protein